jgi:hypothetical protein
VRDHTSYLYKTVGKIIVLYIQFFIFGKTMKRIYSALKDTCISWVSYVLSVTNVIYVCCCSNFFLCIFGSLTFCNYDVMYFCTLGSNSLLAIYIFQTNLVLREQTRQVIKCYPIISTFLPSLGIMKVKISVFQHYAMNICGGVKI